MPVLQVDTASRKVVVANAGDSRCVVSKRGQAVDMSHDHKPTDPREESRISKVSPWSARAQASTRQCTQWLCWPECHLLCLASQQADSWPMALFIAACPTVLAAGVTRQRSRQGTIHADCSAGQRLVWLTTTTTQLALQLLLQAVPSPVLGWSGKTGCRLGDGQAGCIGATGASGATCRPLRAPSSVSEFNRQTA